MEQFIDNNLELRIILVDTNQSKDLGAQLPNPEEVISKNKIFFFMGINTV